MSRIVSTLSCKYIELADRSRRNNGEGKISVRACKTHWNHSLVKIYHYHKHNQKICDRKMKGNTKPLSLTNLCHGYRGSVLTCTSKLQTHLRWSGSSVWQLWIDRNIPPGSLCLGVPFQKVLQSFPLTFHSFYWTKFVFIAPFAFPAMLSVTCVEYGFCRLAK